MSTIIFIGPAGSGKTTCGDYLRTKHNYRATEITRETIGDNLWTSLMGEHTETGATMCAPERDVVIGCYTVVRLTREPDHDVELDCSNNCYAIRNSETLESLYDLLEMALGIIKGITPLLQIGTSAFT
jgi:adenylate kinase family enzyme